MDIAPAVPTAHAKAFLFTFDEAYAKYFSVALASLAIHVNKDTFCDIVILHDGVSDETIARLQDFVPRNFTLRFFDVGDYARELLGDIESKTIADKWNVAVFYDLLAPLIMSSYERVLFCDSDIVFDADPSELFEMPFDGAQLIAVRDSLSVSDAFRPLNAFDERQLVFIRETLGIDNLDTYFNGGVLLFNIKAIDKDAYLGKVRQALRFERLPTVDQDVLNYVFRGSVKIAPQRYNFQAHLSYASCDQTPPKQAVAEYLEAAREPVVIHFTTDFKPWKSEDCAMKERFWNYVEYSPWGDELLRDRRNRIIRDRLKRLKRFARISLKNIFQTH